MKLDFEKWLIEQNISEDAKGIFEESIRCYKNSAYRASLLFSFLGLQIILKDRIQNANRAECYEEAEWQQRQKELRDYEIWEIKLTNLMHGKKPPFKMTEDLKRQYTYWKDRRNDCAHSKGNLISYPHVENFWLFLQSNLSKFVINGGLQSVLQDVSIYLNSSLTPAHADIRPLIQKIRFALEREEYIDFLSEFYSSVVYQEAFGYVIKNPKIIKLWEALFSLEDRQDILVKFLLETEKLPFTIKVIRTKPEIIKYFKDKTKFVRYLWKEEFKRSNDYLIFIELLRNNIIPEGEILELYHHMFNNVESTSFELDESNIDFYGIEVIQDVDIYLLKSNGFFEEFYNQAIKAGKITGYFEWGNRNKELFLFYLKHFNMDEEIVLRLNRVLDMSYSPKKLKEMLYSFYRKNPDVQEKHAKVCDETGVPLMMQFSKKVEIDN